jgi:methylmalonyl-CoA/ethylmalonyl-CoA epimerase
MRGMWPTIPADTCTKEPPMKIKRIEHVAIAVKSIKAMRDIFEKKLGIEMEYEEHLPQHSTSLAMFPIGETYLELLQSDKPDSGTSRWIAEHGEGLFHICLEVEDIDAAMAELRGKGVGFQTEKPMIGHGNCRIVFLDPKSTGNLVIELAEMPKAASHAAPHAAK